MLVTLTPSIFIFHRGDQRGSQLKIGFSFLTKGNPKTITTICPRDVLYNTWHKIEVRVQDGEKLLRIYADNKMIEVHRFDYTLPVIPSDSELRLAQVFEVLTEGVGEIQNKFRVSCSRFTFRCSLPSSPSSSPPPPASASSSSLGSNLSSFLLLLFLLLLLLQLFLL